ncbi:nitric oxide dioxygenase, partial [Vibrio vulnificus]
TLSMLESLTEHQAPVTWIHATENGQQHAFKQHVKQLVEAHTHFNSLVWYNQPNSDDKIGDDFQFSGWVNLHEIETVLKQADVQVYFCGPVGFMQFIAKQLLEMGVPEQQFHYECFGPHKVV